MPANTSPLFELTPINKGAQFVNADGTAKKTLVTGGTNGTRIDGISITSNDTATADMNFYITDGATDYYVGTVRVAIGAGYTTVAKHDAVGALAPAGTGVFILSSGQLLKVAATVAVTAAKVVDVVAHGGDF